MGISAFSSQAGINGLGKHILANQHHFDTITIVTGIDQGGTSKEALEALLALGLDSYVFYQQSRTIFHPKIYLFEGKTKTELIVGSSNLTGQGLFANVEASLLVSIDNKIEADREIVKQVKDYFDGIFDLTDPNLVKLSNDLITHLLEEKVVFSESELKLLRKKEEKTPSSKDKGVGEFWDFFPKRAIAKIPKEFRSNTKDKPKAKKETTEYLVDNSDEKRLVWTRKSLPSSSVQGGNTSTNPTGGLRLVQDNFMINGEKIDHTRYFREILFKDYDWSPQVNKKAFVELAFVPFLVTIKEAFIGNFLLEIRHKPSGEAGQRNYTTSISWGELGKTIQESNLTDSRLDIYAPLSEGEPFLMIIS